MLVRAPSRGRAVIVTYSIWTWGAGFASLVAALVGLYYTSRLNRLVKGGLIGSSVGYAIFGFVILAILVLFDELIAFARPLLPYTVEQLTIATELLRLLALIFFTHYFHRLYRGFSGYAKSGGSGKSGGSQE
jgi:hypothetical protein